MLRAPCMGRCDLAPVAEVGHFHVDFATPETVQAAIAAGQRPPDDPALRGLCHLRRPAAATPTLAALRDGARTREEVEAALLAAGLRGLGGAGFPTGRKWSAVRAHPAPRYLAVNADEGEPGTFKDRYYLERAPHAILEGMLIAAWAVEAAQAWISTSATNTPRRCEILRREIAAARGGGPRRAGLHRAPPRRRRLHLRRGVGDDRVDRGQARAAAPPPALRGGGRDLRPADAGAERRDAASGWRGSAARGRRC